jgi:hypothetical protein
MKTMNKKTALLVASIFIALFFIMPLSSVIKSINLRINGVRTEATVTGRDTRGKGLARVTVTFNLANGEQITATKQKNNYVSTGDKIKVWYDKENPQNIDFGDTLRYNMRGVLIVGFMLAFILYFFIKTTIADAANKKLISSGKKISAEFISIGRNEQFKMGDKNPWVIKCKWTDPGNNKEYLFESNNYTIDPSPYLKGRNQIEIFINPADPAKYLMDASFMPEGDITTDLIKLF